MKISLAEAASILGVTKETLRNWDRSGKLRPFRDPANNYRSYHLADVQALLERASETPATAEVGAGGSDGGTSDRETKRILARIHKIIRDSDGSSSIVERFDETTKLIFLKLHFERMQRSAEFSQSAHETDAKYAKRLKGEFNQAAKDRPEVFPERFSAIKLSNAALVAAAKALASVDLLGSKQDVKGLAYEEMIKNTFDKGDNQQFFTPAAVVQFMVGLMAPNLNRSVCDPACGTGGFLVELCKQGIPTKKIVGLEIDDRLAWVTGINLLIHGATNFQVDCLSNGGSLGEAGRKYHRTFEAIITNPPFGSDFTERKDLEQYILGKGKTSRRRGVLFVEKCLSMLKDGGVLAIVIDEGVLSLPSSRDVRELILAQADLLAVISLPETAFMPYASVNTSILILKKTSNANKASKQMTFFAAAESVGRKPNGDPEIEYDEDGSPSVVSDLPRILEAWRRFSEFGQLDQGTDDSIYLSDVRPASLRDGDNRLDFKFHHPSRMSAQIGLQQCRYPLKTLAELCDVRNESFVPSVDFPDQSIPYTGLAHIAPRVGQVKQVIVSGNSLKSSVKRYYRGDLLFAKMRPNLRKAAAIEFDSPGYASAECVVLTPKAADDGFPVIDLGLLSILLRSDQVYGQIIHLIAGIGRPRLALKDLLSVRLPVPPREHQRAFKDAFAKTKETYEGLRIEAKKLDETANEMELRAIDGVAESFLGRFA